MKPTETQIRLLIDYARQFIHTSAQLFDIKNRPNFKKIQDLLKAKNELEDYLEKIEARLSDEDDAW